MVIFIQIYISKVRINKNKAKLSIGAKQLKKVIREKQTKIRKTLN